MKIDANKVKKLRTSTGWTQEELSERSGVNLRTVQRVEATGSASAETVRLLTQAFGVAADELIVLEKEPTPLDAVRTGLQQFANFSDTATRYEYWWFLAFALLVLAIATVIHERAYQIVGIILLLPLLAASTRRLNDAGRSGWWQLLLLVPFGQVVVLFLLAQKRV